MFKMYPRLLDTTAIPVLPRNCTDPSLVLLLATTLRPLDAFRLLTNQVCKDFYKTNSALIRVIFISNYVRFSEFMAFTIVLYIDIPTTCFCFVCLVFSFCVLVACFIYVLFVLC
jgi:hypothetical protein